MRRDETTKQNKMCRMAWGSKGRERKESRGTVCKTTRKKKRTNDATELVFDLAGALAFLVGCCEEKSQEAQCVKRQVGLWGCGVMQCMCGRGTWGGQ